MIVHLGSGLPGGAQQPATAPLVEWVELPAALIAGPERLAAARAALGSSATSRALGPFALFTDVTDQRFLDLLERLVTSLIPLWRQRHGLELPPAPGAVVLYERREAYEVAAGVGAEGLSGHAGGGLALVHREAASTDAALRLVAHELTHLASEAAFGRPLPPWLGEGLAEDISLTPIARGRLLDSRLDRRSVYRGPRLTLYGPLVHLRPLRAALDAGELDLEGRLSLDASGFTAVGDRPLTYALYGLWLRHLVEDAKLAAPFAAFLRAGMEGAALDAATLRGALDRSWDELERSLADFLEQLERRLGLPPGL